MLNSANAVTFFKHFREQFRDSIVLCWIINPNPYGCLKSPNPYGGGGAIWPPLLFSTYNRVECSFIAEMKALDE